MLRAFVISLPDALARRSAMRSRLHGQVAYDIIEAIAGKDLRGSQDQSCKDRYCARFFRNLTLNEIACSLSHRKALLQFLESKAHYGLILEDDAEMFPKDFASLNGVIRATGDFDILKIGGCGAYLSPGVVVGHYDAVNILAVLSPSVCSHAYVVSRSGAQKLAKTITPVREPYDAFLRNVYEHQCSVFETSPWLASLSEDASISTIKDDRTSRKRSWSLRKNMRSAAFRLKYNTMRRIFNLRRFGISYLTGSGFIRFSGWKQSA